MLKKCCCGAIVIFTGSRCCIDRNTPFICSKWHFISTIVLPSCALVLCNVCLWVHIIGVGTGGGTGGSAPKFHVAPHPRYTCKCIAISAKPSSVAMSAPPPIKKLKQTTLSFHTTNCAVGPVFFVWWNFFTQYLLPLQLRRGHSQHLGYWKPT